MYRSYAFLITSYKKCSIIIKFNYKLYISSEIICIQANGHMYIGTTGRRITHRSVTGACPLLYRIYVIKYYTIYARIVLLLPTICSHVSLKIQAFIHIIVRERWRRVTEALYFAQILVVRNIIDHIYFDIRSVAKSSN